MTESNKISIEKQIESIPPLPATVTRVMEVTGNPEGTAGELVKAILPDQSMCLAILKIANSVLYGRPKKVSSLETAVVVLGMDEIQNIVLGKAAVTSFKPRLKKYKGELDMFWEHAFTCGLAAKNIGEHINLPAGQFFIAGLLHDIGKLPMFLAFGEKYQPEKWLTGFSSAEKYAAEKQAFSISHDAVGARLLHRWHFPDNLIAALHYHHAPDKSPKLQGYPLVIQLADFLSFVCLHPEVLNEMPLITALHTYLPDFKNQWLKQNLPWEDITLDSWLAWLKVDLAHGSAILDILLS